MPLARKARLFVALASLWCGLVAFAAQRHASATFDETVLVAGGVRGLVRGDWGMVTDQPPLLMYGYGLAARSVGPALPPEDRAWGFDDRWAYARAFFFRMGNDPQALLARARALAALLAAALVAAAAGLAWWVAGPAAGVVTAGLTATLPDVLAHGGVAYNDLPLALAFLLAVWSLDAAVRRPGPARGALAGVAVAAALAVKMSALALLPVAVLLLAAEGWRRRREAAWRGDVAATVGVATATLYVALVLLYRGDPALTLFRFNFWRTVLHASGGHEAPAFLLGRTSPDGFWYYFPVAFFLKTPLAFQALLGLAGWLGWRSMHGAGDGRWARLLAWRGRAALVALAVFGSFLVRSDLNVGFRYALPALPLLAVLAGAVLGPAWLRGWRRPAVAGILALQALTVISAYPHFLSYTSVWAGGRDRAYRALVDSNLDWGQELLSLRDFMEREGVTSVRLSYFGSAPPDGYGIDYAALPSFFRLDPDRTPGAEEAPRFTVISATNLHGLYLGGTDPFEAYRSRVPYAVLGHALFVYDEGGPG